MTKTQREARDTTGDFPEAGEKLRISDIGLDDAKEHLRRFPQSAKSFTEYLQLAHALTTVSLVNTDSHD